jgi:hypothetical protein
VQSWVALGSGGVFGLGLGSSRGKWNFVPNPETDFVFAIIGEELGLVGATGLIVLFVTLLLLGLHAAFTAAPGYDRTLAFTITTWIVGQAFVNIGTVIGLLPITGVTLPLVSAGGSSLLVTMVALGLLINVARLPDEAIAGPGRRETRRLTETRDGRPARRWRHRRSRPPCDRHRPGPRAHGSGAHDRLRGNARQPRGATRGRCGVHLPPHRCRSAPAPGLTSTSCVSCPDSSERSDGRGALLARSRCVSVVSFGGYVALPVSLAARGRVPQVLHEQNSRPGLANRIAARYADRIAVTFPSSVDGFPAPHART